MELRDRVFDTFITSTLGYPSIANVPRTYPKVVLKTRKMIGDESRFKAAVLGHLFEIYPSIDEDAHGVVMSAAERLLRAWWYAQATTVEQHSALERRLRQEIAEDAVDTDSEIGDRSEHEHAGKEEMVSTSDLREQLEHAQRIIEMLSKEVEDLKANQRALIAAVDDIRTSEPSKVSRVKESAPQDKKHGFRHLRTIPEKVLLCPRSWLEYGVDGERIGRELHAYFRVDVPRGLAMGETRYREKVRSSIQDYLEKRQDCMVSEVFATRDQPCDAVLDSIETELRKLDTEKVLVLYGKSTSEVYRLNVEAQDEDIPDWLKARKLAIAKNSSGHSSSGGGSMAALGKPLGKTVRGPDTA